MRMPRDSARVMQAVMPRSLKEPVGLLPWCLMVRWTGPAHHPVRRVPTKGVEPSEREMMRAPESTKGISSRKRHTPLRSIGSPLSRRWCQVRRSLRIEGVEFILHIEQAAAECAGVCILLGVLATPAGFLDALEISADMAF